MEMKNLRVLFLMAIPVLFLSCTDGTNKKRDDENNRMRNRERNQEIDRNQQQEQDKTKTEVDTLSRGSMFFFRLQQDNNDEEFVKNAASSGLLELELAELAGQNATNPRVKEFAAMLLKDHRKSSEELKSIAREKNINVPANLDEKHLNKVEELKLETGAEFDKAYLKELVECHESDVDLYQKQAENGKVPELKSFASKNLPVLLVHRDSVKAIQKDLK